MEGANLIYHHTGKKDQKFLITDPVQGGHNVLRRHSSNFLSCGGRGK
jgi:hypothetical protein